MPSTVPHPQPTRRVRRLLLIVSAILLMILGIGPFLLPLPSLETVPPQLLADSDSQFTEVNGIQVHFKAGGTGTPALVLLHGFGASLFSWRELFADPSPLGRLYAFDRPAFGLTERRLPGAYSPEDQIELTIALLDQWGIDQAILVGNSAGGTIAVRTAVKHPDRVRALILVSPAIYTGGGAPVFIRPLLGLPQAERIGRYVIRRALSRGESLVRLAWHDPSRLSQAVIEGYRKPLQADDWDRALWAFTVASKSFSGQEALVNLTIPVLVVSGEHDRIVPVEDSIRLSQSLPNAQLAVIPNCGHVAHEECPDEFLDVARQFIQRHSLGSN